MSLLNRYSEQNRWAYDQPFYMPGSNKPVDPATMAMVTGRPQDDMQYGMAISRDSHFDHPDQESVRRAMGGQSPAGNPEMPKGNLGKIIAGGLSAMGGAMGGPRLDPAMFMKKAPPMGGPAGTPAAAGAPGPTASPGPPPGMQFGGPPGPSNPLDEAYARQQADVGPRAAITPTPGGLPPAMLPPVGDPMLMRQQSRTPYPIY